MKTAFAIKKFLTFAALLALASCGKKDDAAPSASGTAGLLTASPWKLEKTEWRQTDGGKWVAQASAQQTLSFFGNNTYSSGGSATSSGTWQLSGDNARLTIYNGSSGRSATLAIEALTASTLQLTTPLTDTYTVSSGGGGPAYVYYDEERATYGH